MLTFYIAKEVHKFTCKHLIVVNMLNTLLNVITSAIYVTSIKLCVNSIETFSVEMTSIQYMSRCFMLNCVKSTRFFLLNKLSQLVFYLTRLIYLFFFCVIRLVNLLLKWQVEVTWKRSHWSWVESHLQLFLLMQTVSRTVSISF